MNRVPFAPHEWYHCFNRGVEKRVVFSEELDYQRFVELLYVCNTEQLTQRSRMTRREARDMLHDPQEYPIVSIGAYCLMPNHFHLLLKTEKETGITQFMRKLMTAYTMYYNIRHQRTGNLFVKPFRSRHVSNDGYFQRVIEYIHCNPAELFESGWKDGDVNDLDSLVEKLSQYPYSSLGAFFDESRRRGIVDTSVFDTYRLTTPDAMIREAAAYYQETVR